jgi:hypothetical protein
MKNKYIRDIRTSYTKGQLKLQKALQDLGFAVDLEEPFHIYRIDCYVKEFHLGFEYDGCFPSDTKVLCLQNKIVRSQFIRDAITREKLIPISIRDIKIGDKVLSYNETTGKKEIKEVTKTFVRSSLDLIELIFSNGNRLECTREHPIAVIIDGSLHWKKACEIQDGDKVIQYLYNGLSLRLRNLVKTGQTNEDFFGVELAREISRKRSITITGEGNPNFGNHPILPPTWNTGLTKDNNESLMRMSEKMKIRWLDDDYRNNLELKRIENRDAIREMWDDPKSYVNSQEYRKILSDGVKNSYTDELRDIRKKDLTRRLLSKDMHRTMSSSERELLLILDNNFPNQWMYVGDYSFFVANSGKIRNPDFKHVKFNKVIEVFCLYFKIKIYGSVDEYKRITSLHYNEKGYDVLYVTDKEVKQNDISSKINVFTYNPSIEIVSVVDKKYLANKCDVYNLEVKDNNTFFANGILVHNCGHSWKKKDIKRDLFLMENFKLPICRLLDGYAVKDITDFIDKWAESAKERKGNIY